MGRFYRHVLVGKHYPHHGAVAFRHVGKALFSAAWMKKVEDRIIRPTVEGLAAEGIDPLKNETFRTIVGTKSKTIAINNSSKTLTNTNELLGYLNGVYGVKTGFTNGANRCLVTAINRNGFDIICIVLGADTKKDRTQDSIKLIEYVFNNFSLFNLKEKITSEFENWKLCNYNSFEISKGISNNVELCLENLKYDFLPLTSNQIQNLNIYIYCDYKFNAPLEENHILGYLNVYIDNQNILTLNIYNSNFIDKKNSTDFFIELLKKYIYYLESIFFCD